MNKLICPLSEEFLYCSPERPEKECYKVLMEKQQSMQILQKNYIVGRNSHMPQKDSDYKKSLINWQAKNITQFVIFSSAAGVAGVIVLALLMLLIESIQ